MVDARHPAHGRRALRSRRMKPSRTAWPPGAGRLGQSTPAGRHSHGMLHCHQLSDSCASGLPHQIEFLASPAFRRRAFRSSLPSELVASTEMQESFMSTKLYVGNLPFETTEADLQALFESSGTVTTVTIVKDRATGRGRGFGFVEMS